MRAIDLRRLVFSALAVGASGICHAQAPPTVAVSLTGDDDLTKELQHALELQVSRLKDIRLVRGENEARFVIRTPSNVTSDKLGNRGVLVYHALLLEGGRVLVDRLGACYETQPEKCARDIVRGFSRVIRDYARRSR